MSLAFVCCVFCRRRESLPAESAQLAAQSRNARMRIRICARRVRFGPNTFPEKPAKGYLDFVWEVRAPAPPFPRSLEPPSP